MGTRLTPPVTSINCHRRLHTDHVLGWQRPSNDYSLLSNGDGLLHPGAVSVGIVDFLALRALARRSLARPAWRAAIPGGLLRRSPAARRAVSPVSAASFHHLLFNRQVPPFA